MKAICLALIVLLGGCAPFLTADQQRPQAMPVCSNLPLGIAAYERTMKRCT